VSRILEVLDPGLFTTVQDAGRPGHARLGVSAAGAADPVALRLANLLAGNDGGAPALEMTLAGGTFRFAEAAMVALGGADMEAALDGRPLPPWTAARAAPGATLRCGATRRGARTVLAIGGGIAVPPVLDSASTHVPSGLGGLEGRALRRGDRLPLGASPDVVRAGRLDAETRARLEPAAAIRVTRGAQWEALPAAARQALFDAPFTVSATSDRMGIRLDGPRIDGHDGGTMITEGMPLGAIQIPPGGQPVILFVDHQTTGGYPVIAVVVSADLARLGQLRPGEPVRFDLVSLEEARALLIEQARWLGAARVVAP
jgi:biotin-dependent carboxylase-like uncharacterized protein